MLNTIDNIGRYTIKIKIEFDAAHRILEHQHKCKFLHGHRYIVEITLSAQALDSMGFVADFGDIKLLLKTWIDKNLDHTCILSSNDQELGAMISNATGQTIYYLPSSTDGKHTNPTAENIARHLFQIFTYQIKTLNTENNLSILQVCVQETPSSSASFEM